MVAQGESYESPIGAMFSRAYDRFRVAEQVRQDERTLRQVLEEETRAGGEMQMRQLVELEFRQRDVWGVPQPLLDRQGSPNEVLGRATRNGEESNPRNSSSLPRRPERSASNSSEQPLSTNDPEVTENHRAVSSGQVLTDSRIQAHRVSPRYESVTDERLRDLMLPSGQLAQPEDTPLEDMVQIINSWPENERAPPYLALVTLIANENLRESIGWTIEDLRSVATGFMSTPSDHQRSILDEASRLESVAWTAGLPSARLAIYRLRGPVFEVNDAVSAEVLSSASDTHAQDCIEWMAEAFQLSSGLRARSHLTPPERLPLLYRLQAGERRPADRDLLGVMLQDRDTVTMARDIHRGEISARALQQISAMDQARQDRAQEGNFSRAELDAQRQATHAIAVAAGRTAMLTGPQALLQQSISRLSETPEAILSALRMGQAPEIIFDDSASGAEDGSNVEECGLDDPDSGRPAAKEDEEMNVRMDCRVCFTQLAEIACLPCGHLVMCRWCSDQHSPTMQHDRTRPRRAAGCPVCRKGIRQKVRVFRA
nr:hypothetical protein CFP56_79208 [Quercus suber]